MAQRDHVKECFGTPDRGLEAPWRDKRRAKFFILFAYRFTTVGTGMKGVQMLVMGPFPWEGSKSYDQWLSLSVPRYLVDPASNICLSQRLSHACLSINDFIL